MLFGVTGKRLQRKCPTTPILLVAGLVGLLYWNHTSLTPPAKTGDSLHGNGGANDVTDADAATPHGGDIGLDAARAELNVVRAQLAEITEERDEVAAAQSEAAASLRDVQASLAEVKAKVAAAQAQRRAGSAVPGGGTAVATAAVPAVGGPIDFDRTAIVTMATGNDAARGVIALVQSLRDSNTQAQDIVVMLSRGGGGSPECRGEDGGVWSAANQRRNVRCSGPDTIAEEIISPKYVNALKRMGATLLVVDEIPSTRYTEHIPGGRSTFWGMALNKLRVFNLTQYRKVRAWWEGESICSHCGCGGIERIHEGCHVYECCTEWVAERALRGDGCTYVHSARFHFSPLPRSLISQVLWMDGDTLVLKNVDHLFNEPMFTAAMTEACCNPNGPAIISGGLWVVEPR